MHSSIPICQLCYSNSESIEHLFVVVNLHNMIGFGFLLNLALFYSLCVKAAFSNTLQYLANIRVILINNYLEDA